METFSPLLLLLFASLGGMAGFLAGLLGIGGGVILVPLFLKIFPLIGFPEATLVHTALGTSLAIILPTAISSSLGHRKHGNVDWHMVMWLASGSVSGALVGAWAASLLSGAALKGCFGLTLMGIGLHFLFYRLRYLPAADLDRPVPWRLLLVGLCSGSFSAFFGVGGGIISVPLMVIVLRLPILLAVGNSSAVIVASTFFGSLSYMVHGWHVPQLPPYSMGYINVPIAVVVACFSMICARLGVKVASRFSRDRLKKLFACLLIVIGLRLIWQSFG